MVATEVGGVPEIVSHEESALLVPAGDTVQLAAAIARVLSDNQLAERLTANAAHLIATRHAPETYARNLLEIYEGVLQMRREREK